MKITTKTGDKGKTGLFNGKRLSKGDEIFELLGNLDELNSALGMCRALFAEQKDGMNQHFNALIKRIQKDIYRIMSFIGNEMKYPENISAINNKDIEFLEDGIERMSDKTQNLTEFVLPGENELDARYNVARTTCRRAERSFVKSIELKKEQENFDEILKYLNRLSDLLFVLGLS